MQGYIQPKANVKKRLNKKIEYYQVVNRNTISNDNEIFFIQLQHVTESCDPSFLIQAPATLTTSSVFIACGCD